jgi:chromosome segregation ATPase
MDELIQQKAFDFTSIDDTATRTRVIERDVRFDFTKQQVESGLIEMGRILIEQKADLQHGQWKEWLDSKDVSQRTAQSLMQINEKLSNAKHVSYLGIRVLQLLSQDSTPESARTEAIEKAENGKKLTVKEAKQLVEAHRRIDALEKDLASAKDQIPTDDVKAKIDDLEARLEAEKNKPVSIQYRDKIPEDYEELQKRKDELATEKMQLKSEMAQMKANFDLELKKTAASGETIPADYADLSLAKEMLTRDKSALVTRLEQINSENEKLSEKVKTLKKEQDGKIAQAVNLRMREMQDEFDTKEKQIASVQARIDALQPEMNRLERKVGDLSAIRESEKEIRQHLMGISIVLGDLFSDVDIPESANKGLMVLANEMAQGVTAFKNYLTGTKHIGEYHEE